MKTKILLLLSALVSLGASVYNLAIIPSVITCASILSLFFCLLGAYVGKTKYAKYDFWFYLVTLVLLLLCVYDFYFKHI